MPQDYKTCINNLIIVWQGSSWSVIAPDGTVIARFFDKPVAVDYAKSVHDYASDKYRPYSGETSYDIDGIDSMMPSDILQFDRNIRASLIDLKWLRRRDIFRVTDEANPPYYVGVSVAHDQHDHPLVLRADLQNSNPPNMMYIDPGFIESNAMPVFRLDIISYRKITPSIQVLNRTRYFEDISTIYVAVKEVKDSESSVENKEPTIAVGGIYRKDKSTFRRTNNFPDIDFPRYISGFMKRAKKGQPSKDQRVPAWDNRPTIYGMYCQQQEIERNNRHRAQKNPKQK